MLAPPDDAAAVSSIRSNDVTASAASGEGEGMPGTNQTNHRAIVVRLYVCLYRMFYCYRVAQEALKVLYNRRFVCCGFVGVFVLFLFCFCTFLIFFSLDHCDCVCPCLALCVTPPVSKLLYG